MPAEWPWLLLSIERRRRVAARPSGLKENSVSTYVDRTGRFLKWLNGDYRPGGLT